MNDENKTSLKKLAPSIVTEGGKILPFEEQIDRFAYNELTSADMLIVSEKSEDLGFPKYKNFPCLITQETLTHIRLKHDLPFRQLKELPQMFKESPLILQSRSFEDSLLFVFNEKDQNGHYIICAVRTNNEKRDIEINSISSIYGKEKLVNLIINTINDDKEFWTNKKTNDWLKLLGVQFPQAITNRLVNNYITEDKNTISDEKAETDYPPDFDPHPFSSEYEDEMQKKTEGLISQDNKNDDIEM